MKIISLKPFVLPFSLLHKLLLFPFSPMKNNMRVISSFFGTPLSSFFFSFFFFFHFLCFFYPLKRALSFHFPKDPCPFIFQEAPTLFPKKPCLFTSQETHAPSLSKSFYFTYCLLFSFFFLRKKINNKNKTFF